MRSSGVQKLVKPTFASWSASLRQVAQEGAAGAHLAAGFGGQQVGHERSPVRAGNRDQPAHAFQAAQPLDVVAGDDSAHAEADEVEAFAARDVRLHIGTHFFRLGLDAGLPPTGRQGEGVHFRGSGQRDAV